MSALMQGSLFGLESTIALSPLAGSVQRRPLSRGAWIDLLPGWVSGSDALFDEVVDAVPWHAEERQMYDRVVDVPRLLCFYGCRDPLPHPTLTTARDLLNDYYADELGEPFATAGMCLYRDGRDSVAWHGDTIGRGAHTDTMVAIISLGSPRSLLLRPRGGGAALKQDVGHGDLVVMGGSCQRTWEHSIPKTSKPVGPRISIQFRPIGVR